MPKKGQSRRKVPVRGRVSLAQKRKKQRIIAAIVGSVLLLALCGGFLYVVRLPEVSIQDIQVEGTYAVSPELVRGIVEQELKDSTLIVIPRRMIFTYPGKDIENALLQHIPRLQSLSLSRDSLFGTTLIVSVVERNAYGIWCAGESEPTCYKMDASGFIFAPADSFAEYYLFYGGMATDTDPIARYFYPDHMEALRNLLNQLSPAGLDPHVVRVLEGSDVEIELLDGMRIRASLEVAPAETVSLLEAALGSDTLKERREDIEYLDARFDNRVYFKFKGEE